MSHEVELKFDLAPGDVERLRACPALAAEPARTAHYETRYFDTGDGALRSAGFSLRIRRVDRRYAQTVKRKRGQRRRALRAPGMGAARSPDSASTGTRSNRQR